MPHDGMHEAASEDAAALLERAFIDGYRQATDKRAFLEMAGIPFELEDGLKLLEIKIEESFEVGQASPAFGSKELVYHPLPGGLIQGKATVLFAYVDRDRAYDKSFTEVMTARGTPVVSHHHHHSH